MANTVAPAYNPDCLPLRNLGLFANFLRTFGPLPVVYPDMTHLGVDPGTSGCHTRRKIEDCTFFDRAMAFPAAQRVDLLKYAEDLTLHPLTISAVAQRVERLTWVNLHPRVPDA